MTQAADHVYSENLEDAIRAMKAETDGAFVIVWTKNDDLCAKRFGDRLTLLRMLRSITAYCAEETLMSDDDLQRVKVLE